MSGMYRFAKETALRVRAELFRLGCSKLIFVEQKETWLKLTYGEQCYVTAPLALLTKLRKIHEVRQVDDLWQSIKQEPTTTYECTVSKVLLVTFLLIVISIAMLIIYVF